jgi:ribosomal protein S12 methylthiotransferase
VVAEARQLVAEGVRELDLISQDTTFFGMDTWEERPGPRTPVDSARGTALTSLLRQLEAIEGDFWVRLLYTHPAHWSDELIQTIAACRKVARYVDMPLQHISDRMLSAMQRETSGGFIRDLVARIRKGVPGIALRTTFIVGFPGETEVDVDELCDFVSDVKFERLGVFRYSQEEGTRAAKLPGQVPAADKERRWRRVMKLQKEIAAEAGRRAVGRRLKVLVEEPGVARSEADAPDIDGRVYVPRGLPVGEFAEVAVTGSRDYDLLALPDGQEPAEFKVAKQAQ